MSASFNPAVNPGKPERSGKKRKNTNQDADVTVTARKQWGGAEGADEISKIMRSINDSKSNNQQPQTQQFHPQTQAGQQFQPSHTPLPAASQITPGYYQHHPNQSANVRQESSAGMYLPYPSPSPSYNQAQPYQVQGNQDNANPFQPPVLIRTYNREEQDAINYHIEDLRNDAEVNSLLVAFGPANSVKFVAREIKPKGGIFETGLTPSHPSGGKVYYPQVNIQTHFDNGQRVYSLGVGLNKIPALIAALQRFKSITDKHSYESTSGREDAVF